MIPSIEQPRRYRIAYGAYVAWFYLFLAAPLVVVAVFAFNDSLFPSLPWNGFTLDWFTGSSEPRLGLFHDKAILESIGISAFVAFWVTLLSLFVGTCNAFLFERYDFRFKELLYMLMLLPLVIPGVILGISILVFSNSAVNWIDEAFNFEIEALRPGLLLVVLGQFAFITTIATMVLSARLRKMGLPYTGRRVPRWCSPRACARWTGRWKRRPSISEQRRPRCCGPSPCLI